MSLADIGKASESVEGFINGIARALRERRWVKILSLLGVVCALLLNPASVGYGLKFLSLKAADWKTPTPYLYIWLIVTASFFVAAFLIAVLTKEEEKTDAPLPTSIIKGLLPYTNTKEDAEWFARLQRGTVLHDCLRFCQGTGFSFAILSGESGTGKTSFLQAGLSPNLEQQGHRPVYVKFTHSPPLDSIRQALNGGQDDPVSDAPQNLLKLLRQATRENDRPVVLILDQFEQFFTHNKTKTSRKPFIQQMAEWHGQCSSLPVKILISIRDDFADRLTEFQMEMEYTLTALNKLRLEKFEPQEAASVINVIAREAKIPVDEAFVKELTIHELADREEGTVSPVDIQIFSWMLDGQKSSEERAFNRKAFQKLGGVEGLLERFLNRQLNARETEARRQAAIKVMLALTDQNVRAGALSLKDLKEKLSGIVPGDAVEEAALWLARSEVRLITPVQEKAVTLYELAHERIIPPLRRLISEDTEGLQKAQQTLDRRVNEWVGNNRSRRYLLTFKEWRLIKSYWTLITLGTQKKQKEEFLSLSKRRFVITGLSFAAILILGLGGYAGYAWYEQRPETQINDAQKRLGLLLDGTKGAKETTSAALLLSVLDDEKDKELSQKLWSQINSLAPYNQARVWLSLAEAYVKLSKSDEAVKGLDKVRQAAEKLDSSDQARVWSLLVKAYGNLPKSDEAVKGLDKVRQMTENRTSSDQAPLLSFLAEAYGNLPKSDEAVKGLDKVRQMTEKLAPSLQADVWSSLAEAYVKLSKSDEAAKVLAQAQRAANATSQDIKSNVLVEVATLYAKLSRWSEAIGAAQSIGSEEHAILALSRILIIWRDAKNGTKNMDALEDLFEVAEKSFNK